MTSDKPNQPTSSTTIRLKLDRQGGALLRDTKHSRLEFRQQRLRFLQLIGGPQLRELNLSRCAPGLELSLRDCPRLRRIYLPDKGEGAVLHLDFGAAAARLEVLGTIHSIDACWEGGSFAVEAGQADAFRHARIGSGAKLRADAHEIRIEHGPPVPDVLQLADDAAVRQLVVVDAARLRELHLPRQRKLERVTIQNCSSLTTVHGDRVHRLRLDGCGALAAVEVGGHAVTVAAGSGAAAGLRIEHPWNHLTIADTPARRLRAPAVGQLILRDCAALMHAEVAAAAITLSGRSRVALGSLDQLHLDQRAVVGLLARAAAGDTVAEHMLVHWCSHARKAADYLETLCALADSDADPIWLWRLRCRLHARCNLGLGALPDEAGCQQYALHTWIWRFPNDRYLEGWEADARLWLRARRQLPELETMLRRQPPLLAIAVLTRQMGEQVLTAHTLRLLVRVIRRAHKHSLGIDDQPGDEGRAMSLLASSAIALRSPPLADALLQRLQNYPPVKHNLSVLGTLAAFGHAGARATLMSMAQSGPSELRPQALSLALSPIRSDVLSEKEEAYA